MSFLKKKTKLSNFNFFLNFKHSVASLFNIDSNTIITYHLYKYDPYVFFEPWVQNYIIPNHKQYPMLLDNLFLLKNDKDESISFRRSCREGICGSCAMNINGENTLACTFVMKDYLTLYNSSIRIFPLPHMPIVKDLIVSMKHFYLQYKSIYPFLKKSSVFFIFKKIKKKILFKFLLSLFVFFFRASKEQVQFDRSLLNGLYECILCACCSTSCPSYWWNQDRYLGPAVLLQAYRWIIDSRDDFFFYRLNQLNDSFKIGRCHSILNCVSACPKGLNPAEAINNIKSLLFLRDKRKGVVKS
jgi:succinate dehydrogenase / fumarate reductase iron-sulfur subunit